MQLSDIDQVKQGVIAAKMGIKLYRSLGYKHLDDVHLDGDDTVPQGATVAVMEYDGSKVSVELLRLLSAFLCPNLSRLQYPSSILCFAIKMEVCCHEFEMPFRNLIDESGSIEP